MSLGLIMTHKLRSDRVAQRQLLAGVEAPTKPYLNNRAESSHRPTRDAESAGAAVQIVQTSPALPLCSRIYLRALPIPPGRRG
jgi:transposase-like protein